MPEQRKTTAMTDKEKREALHAAESRLNIDGHFDLASKMLAIAADYALATTEPTGWQPIETAPKDGTKVLVYAARYDDLPSFQCVASWTEEGGWCVDELRRATHWMPLPPPPKGGQP